MLNVTSPPHEPAHGRVGRLRQAERRSPVGGQALDDQADAVDAAPHHERPRRAVPQAAEQHREHEVPVRVPAAAAVAAEGDVEVVAQPARQRHVPAAPEVLQAQGDVGRVEVRREADAEEQRDADGDVGVAAEVGVDLERVAVDGEQDLERAVVAGRGEDLVDDGAGQEARHHHLLEHARRRSGGRRGPPRSAGGRPACAAGAGTRWPARSARPRGGGRTTGRRRSRAARPASGCRGRRRSRSSSPGT